ncbi:hypothetical protein NAAC61_08245 [Petrotoga sp. 8T1HF07.NaAc.6.1]|jgi:hypothetical protein|uniref:hypothetical protein n=1 Tax=Petrotoga sp. 8T1HF07.NaAc.6.1 TaxID=1351838 RepID=UPI00192AAC56|nr:hypothetical protein [Petrotoga sp. 8T1HF07.NaAc.6.1]MBL5982005.1 hypothetical protein [Petrotoga sp. 8T1HF07.NaAc.6.1]
MDEKWKSLIEEYIDDLRILVEWAIGEALDIEEGIVDVILDENGKVYTVNSPSKDTIASEVRSGKAIYIGRFDAKDYDFKDIIHNLKEEEFKALFEGYEDQKYLKEYVKSFKEFEDPAFFETLPNRIKNHVYMTIFSDITYKFFKENNLEYNWDFEAELEDRGYISDTLVINEDLSDELLLEDDEDF